MIVRTVPFPDSPQETVAKIDELRPFIDAYYDLMGKGDSKIELPSNALAIFWWQNIVDFIEVLDGDKRVGLLMCNLYISEATRKRYATVAVAYIAPEHRGKGYFKRMLEYAKVVYQARNVTSIEATIPKDKNFPIGEPVSVVYRTEL